MALDYVIEWEDPKNPGRRGYLVRSEAVLASLPADTAPCSKAYTNGYALMWMRGLDGEWTPFGGEGA